MTHLEGIRRTIPKNRTLYHQGDPPESVFVIHDGIVKLFTPSLYNNNRNESDNPSERLSDVAGPGDILGLHHQTHPHTAYTAEETTVTILDPQFLLRGDASHMLLEYVAYTNQRNERRNQHQEYPVPLRFAEVLYDLATRFPNPDHPHKSVPLPLTHTDFGDLILSSRVTITRYTKELEAFGAIERPTRGKYEIHHDLLRTYIDTTIDEHLS